MSQELLSPDHIAKLLQDLHGIRRQDRDLAIAQLKSLDRNLLINELARLVAAPEPLLRATVVEAMILVDVEQMLEYILPRLMDNDSEVRWTVCYWLMEFGDRRAVEPLTRVLLSDPDVIVRTQAATTLGASRDVRAIPALVWARTHDFDVDLHGHSVSYAAEMALRDMGVE
jgi:HEAT repeat protein